MPSHAPILSEDQYFERLAIEYSLMVNEEPTFDCVKGDLTRYRGVIIGSGMYEKGFFRVEVVIPREFPFLPPKIIWYTKIWHPNISYDSPAKVCESILNRDWVPSLHIFSIIETMRALLSYPNPDDPLNTKAARQMKSKSSKFNKQVKENISKHASPELAFW